MLKTFTRNFSALALSATMLLSAVPANPITASAFETEPEKNSVETTTLKETLEDKVSSNLTSEMEKADDNDEFCVYLRLVIPEKDLEIEEEVYARTGLTQDDIYHVSDKEFEEELAKWSDEDEKDLQSVVLPEYQIWARNFQIRRRVTDRKEDIYFETKREVKKEIYFGYNEAILKELNLDVSEDDIVSRFDNQFLYQLCLTKSDIEKAVKNDNVASIYDEYDFEDYIYNSLDYVVTSSPISENLAKKIKQNPDGEIPVCIKCYEQVVSLDSTKDKNAIGVVYNKNIYYTTLVNYVHELDIEKYKPMGLYDSDYTLYLSLPVSEIKRLASSYIVENIDLWTLNPNDKSDDDYEFQYTSEDALRILRASVGLETKHWNAFYDVNQDGSIDSADSLIALRASVKLEHIIYNSAQLYPLYNVEKYGLPEITMGTNIN